jgi:glyoxylase-like metal-dependent hydrolase (beta-lactamase superfamily II)
VGAALAAQHQPALQPTSVNAFLIDTGSRRILIDTGAGPFFGPALGLTLSSLTQAGYAPGTIDEILITHAHIDHIGGLLVGGKVAFPHATLRMSEAERDFWLDQSNTVSVDASVKGTFAVAAAALNAYSALGHLKTFTPGVTLTSGIETVALPGHTAGHTAYRIHSGGKTLLIWGDVVHVGRVQMADPEIAIKFDSNQQQAIRSRLAIFADAANTQELVAGAHLPFPGIGRVRQAGTAWTWMPVTP